MILHRESVRVGFWFRLIDRGFAVCLGAVSPLESSVEPSRADSRLVGHDFSDVDNNRFRALENALSHRVHRNTWILLLVVMVQNFVQRILA